MSRACPEVERKLLRLLHGHKTRTRLRDIHAHFLRNTIYQSNLLLAHFVSICGSLRKTDYANRIFRQTKNPNILLFNAMIKAYSLDGPFEESLLFFCLMKQRGIWPDEYTFAPLLKSCSCLSDLRIRRCVHGDVIRNGFERFGSMKVGVVELYSACGETMGDAEKVFGEIPVRDTIIWNLMIRGFCKRGDVDTGLCLFRQMSEQDRNVVSWNSMISGFSQNGRDREALLLFHEMKEKGVEPDDATLVTVLPVCARLGALDVGQSIRSYMDLNKGYQSAVSVSNAFIAFYCKCGNLETATTLFNEMAQKNVVSWNSMISGLAFHGKGQLGVELFEEMIRSNTNPNATTFIGVLACCSHAGLVEKGRDLFASMIKNHAIEPKHEHYGVMVDLLGRGGCVREAYELLRSMPVKPSAALWGALLGSCRTHGDVKLAEVVAKELIDVEPWNSGNYVLMSNVYAEEGMWEEVERVRVVMKERNVKKSIGQSVIS